MYGMYDMQIKRSGTIRSRSGRAGLVASARWVLVILAISALVAWAELRVDEGGQRVIPVESACVHLQVCIS